jgi:NADP-dependent aldehyde dehydrogenase
LSTATPTSPSPTTGTTDPAAVPGIVRAAAQAGSVWSEDHDLRLRSLRAVAVALDTAVDELVELGQRETHLAEARLRGELQRTTFQLRFLADIVADGTYRRPQVDHADPDWPMGAPRPDLRRVLIPLGPTCVFAASNFPFAFSVMGGDTASALAAGCPVILKAHPGHLELSRRTAALAIGALTAAGAPAGVVQLIEGDEAGRDCLTHPDVKAGAFTGSIRVGRILFDLAASRPQPIPFYGELGSVNPTVVAPHAAEHRATEVAQGFLDSLTLGSGQFCTKPGLLFVPTGSTVLDQLRAADLPLATTMLTSGMEQAYAEGTHHRGTLGGVAQLNRAAPAGSEGTGPRPELFQVSATDFAADRSLQEEIFGPTGLVVTYDGRDDLLAALDGLDGQLTASIHADADTSESPDADLARSVLPALREKAGRLVWNQWPTGVSVTYAQQHGGPYPATTAVATTSVGAAAIDRFLRPVAFQNFPASLLPADLLD